MLNKLNQWVYSFEYWRYLMRYQAPDKLQLAYRKGQFFKTLNYPVFG
jgi:hypothetical protein